MEKSDKRIAAEFDAYCAAAKDHRRFNEVSQRFNEVNQGFAADAKLIPVKMHMALGCCDTGDRNWGHLHDPWCQLANETGQNTSGHARMYVCPDCGVHTVDASHAIVCSMPGNRYRNMANQ